MSSYQACMELDDTYSIDLPDILGTTKCQYTAMDALNWYTEVRLYS